MDHITSPPSPTSRPQIDIPFLGVHYDRKGFRDFPERMGLSDADLYRGDFGSWSIAESAGFLQAWLYFGLIDDVVSSGIQGCTLENWRAISQVNPDDFIRKKPGGCDLITTSKLPSLLREWNQATQSMSPAKKAESGKLIEQKLLFARHVVTTYLQPNSSTWPQVWPLDKIIVMSLRILCSTLGNFAWVLYDQGIDQMVTIYPTGSILWKQIEAAGLDHSTIWFDNLCLSYFLSRLDWPQFTEDEPNVPRGQETDVERHSTKHVISECSCNFIAVDQMELRNIILQRRVPLVSLELFYTPHNGMQPNLSLKSRDLETESSPSYVAISHVWIDGLGNRSRNALPECQLIRLKQMVSSMDDNNVSQSRSRVLFWLDSLCVPRETELKELSLRTINKVFQKATRTLVLDRALMSVALKRPVRTLAWRETDYRYARAVEIIARITLSAWFQRLWTLQEAFFSETLFVQFADYAIMPILELSTIGERDFPYPGNLDHAIDCVGTNLGSKYFWNVHFVNDMPSWMNPMTKLFMLCLVLRCRYTSNWEDESICVATLLDIDVDTILQFQPEDRIGAILKMFPELPSGIAFSTGPRYQEEGMRWAPRSLLRISSAITMDHSSAEVGKLGPSGFIIETIGFIRPYTDWLQGAAAFRNRDISYNLLWVVTLYDEIRTETLPRGEDITVLAERVRQRFPSQLGPDCEDVAFVVNPSEITGIDNPLSQVSGLMLNVTERTPHLITRRVICYVVITPVDMSQFSAEISTFDISFEAMSAEMTPHQQKWCLS